MTKMYMEYLSRHVKMMKLEILQFQSKIRDYHQGEQNYPKHIFRKNI